MPLTGRLAYKWVALSNTTLGTGMAAIDGSIVIISLPAIFRGIGLDPLAPANIGYLLWMILGYLLVSAVLVVALGRLGDMFGRVRTYNLGFVIFTIASLALSVDSFHAQAGAMWLILWRVVQAIGGAMLMANSAAILTGHDFFPSLISGAFHRGLVIVFSTAAAMALCAAFASALRGKRYVHSEPITERTIVEPVPEEAVN